MVQVEKLFLGRQVGATAQQEPVVVWISRGSRLAQLLMRLNMLLLLIYVREVHEMLEDRQQLDKVLILHRFDHLIVVGILSRLLIIIQLQFLVHLIDECQIGGAHQRFSLVCRLDFVDALCLVVNKLQFGFGFLFRELKHGSLFRELKTEGGIRIYVIVFAFVFGLQAKIVA